MNSILKTNRIFFTAATVLAAVCMSCASSPRAEEQSASSEKVYAVTKQFSEKETYVDANILYPSFPDCEPLSRTIKDAVLGSYATFKKDAPELWKEYDDARRSTDIDSAETTSPFTYSVECTVYKDESYISVLVETYTFIGGAHGSTELSSYTYDVRDGTYPTVEQLTGKTDEELSTYCRENLKQTLGDYLWVDQGTQPESKTFSVFTCRNGEIIIYFGQYEVAPYSEGIQTVVVPMAQ